MKQNLLTKFLKRLQFYQGLFVLLLLLVFCSANNVAGADLTVKNITTSHLKQNIITIKGKVTDRTTGQSMPSVTVTVKNTQTATITDADGNYSIKADENATLIFTSVGYTTLELPLQGKKILNVQMLANDKNLGEVVVVGYGSQKKTSLTSAVSTINAAEIPDKPVTNLTNDLVGRATGIVALQGSGEPGFDGSSIYIRGVATTGNSAPLFVVDGVPRDFSRLDPNSIATVTVLKDASAVAPYGVAGANGVILITTKSGKLGKPTLTYNAWYGIQNPTFLPKYVNSFQYATLRNEAAKNDSTALPYTATDLELFQNHEDPDGHADSQPLRDIIIKNRPISYNNLTMSGGTDDIKYFADLGYNTQDGMWTPTYLKKYTGSLNLTAKVTPTTTVDLRTSYAEEDQHFPGDGAGTILSQAQRQNPTYPVLYTNGLPSGYIGQSLWGEIYESGYTTNQNTYMYNQLSIDQQLPIKGLSIKAVVNYDSGPDPLGFSGTSTTISQNWNTPIAFTNPVSATGVYGPGITYTYPINYQGNTKPSLYETWGRNLMFTYQGLINYTNSFGKNVVTGLLVAEYRQVSWETFNAHALNYNIDIPELSFGGPLASDVAAGGSAGGQKSIGYVYRFTDDYDNKYLLEASGRYDGSYVFAPGHRFGFFPAFSAGWRISQEKFMQGVTWVENLKLRGSWGESGNYPNGGQYQYLSSYNIYNGAGVIGNNNTQGIYENLQGNPNITWEVAKKTDVGLEGTFFKGVLGVEADYFYEIRSNLLVSIGAVLPAEYGIGTGQVNGGILSNHGAELTLTSFKKFSDDLRLDLKATFTYAKNKIIQDYENASTYDNPDRRMTGRPLNEQFGLKAIGYFTASDFIDPNAIDPTLKSGIPVPTFGPVHPGDIQYADLNHDGIINANDITDIGHPSLPQIVYGLEPRLTYKHFDVDLLFQGTGLSDIQLGGNFVYPFASSGSASELYYQDHWTPSDPNALYPRVSGTPSANNTQTSSWYLRNDSYIRLKSAELGYTFSSQLLGHTIHSLRVYISGQNLYTLTPWMKETIDPENGGSSNTSYFEQQVLSIGVNATF
jgi:TonB-linked SusC/RagA family outer membrane protein